MKNKFKIKKGLPREASAKWGMTLFIAVVIMGILLLISFAVVNITLKATLFASSGKDSQYAFYAADAGIECAIYWDSKYITGYQGSYPIYGSAFATLTSRSPINCAGKTIEDGDDIPGTTTKIMIGGGGSANPTSIFYFTMDKEPNPVPYCAIVTVTKNVDGTTSIYSRGYNTCDTSHPRRVERGIEIY